MADPKRSIVSRRLGDILPGAVVPAFADMTVTGLTQDSRKVEPGSIFVAIPGHAANGRAFIPAAAAKGAIAVMAEGARPADLPAGVAYVPVDDAHAALSLAAARFHPRQPATMVAVTGTSGKSSVADFTRQIFAQLGREAASIGTVGIVTSRGAAYGSLTTPDPVTLHATLTQLADDGITHAAMEASSHGLDQRRLDGVRLNAAAFLNLGHDHLDYHPTMEAYLAAKMRLFDLLPRDLPAVIQMDGAWSDKAAGAASAAGHPLITVGANGETIRLVSVVRDGFAQRLSVEIAGRRHEVVLPLAGDFMAGNALVAVGLAMATGEDAVSALHAITTLTGVPGRLDQVGTFRGGLAIVDYAHKPDALKAVLTTLRPYATGRLICLVGCGGDRDRTKRPIMGRIAAELADVAIITDDNPRTENPAAIRAEVMAGATGIGTVREIGDRAEAIRAGIGLMGPGDVLVVAGKGHEPGQIIGNVTLPFSDHDEIRKAMADLT